MLFSLATVPVALFVLLLSHVTAQQRPFRKVNKFDTDLNYRTDVCDRQTQLYRDSIDVADALRGLNLSVAITHYTKPYEDSKRQHLTD